MMGIAAPIWNGIAPFVRSPAWRRLFSLSEEAQNVERDRLYTSLLEQGFRHEVASSYLSFAPFLHECEAINAYRSRHPEWSSALPEILSVDEALHYASAENNHLLEDSTLTILARLLRKDPEAILPPVSAEQQEQAWHDEATSMLFLSASDWAVADAVEFPGELLEADALAAEDGQFDEVFDEWLFWAIGEPSRVIAIEQCCDDGVPVSKRERAMKLATAPEDLRMEMEAFWHQCPEHVAMLVAHQVFWMARAERGRRRGFADWTPLYPLPPWWEEQSPVQTFERWCEPPAR